MSQRVQTQSREAEPPQAVYERVYAHWQKKTEQAATGAVVIRSKDLPFEMARQGRLRFFSHPFVWDKQAAPGWLIFEQDIRRHSGKHVHQGGIGIFVLEGTGYTVVNGVRYDWEAGDLILLPIIPGGCEHQHFNLFEGTGCRWVAFVFGCWEDMLRNELKQREVSPDWKQ